MNTAQKKSAMHKPIRSRQSSTEKSKGDPSCPNASVQSNQTDVAAQMNAIFDEMDKASNEPSKIDRAKMASSWFTDMGNAYYFALRYESGVLYASTKGRMFWNGVRWQRDEDGE